MDISRLREALRQGCVDPFAACVLWKDSPSAPPPPDYKAAAEASRANQVTPFGTSTWTPAKEAVAGKGAVAAQPRRWVQTGSNNIAGRGGASNQGYWAEATPAIPGVDAQPAVPASNTITLPPDLQKGLMGITGRVGENMSKGPDLSSVQQVADKAYGAMTSRLDPQWQQEQSMQETQLRNQGLVPGGEAYNNAMRVFNQAKNDAYQRATLGAIQTMPQTYQLATDQHNQPLNQLNAIRSGAQIQGPQFEGSPDYLNAANAQAQYGQGLYNAQVGQQNAMTSGLFGLGGAGLMAYGLAASDRRLKRDIRRVAEDERGWGIYRYRYLDDDRERIGVMADEVERVMPHAVMTRPDGFKAVYYGALYG